MTRHTNQQRSRKSTGTSSFTDAGTPSRAPHQDEDSSVSGSTTRAPHHVDPDSEQQGISNRPTREEHAFPGGPAGSDRGGTENENAQPQSPQQGGAKGNV